MNILAELNKILSVLDLPVETGVFSGKAPAEYIVLTPISDGVGVFGGDRPLIDVSEVRISIFTTGNYLAKVKKNSDLTVGRGLYDNIKKIYRA